MKKTIQINKDVYKYIYTLANNIIRKTENNDIKYILNKVISYYLKFYDRPIEGIIKKVESISDTDSLVKAICFYFIGKTYSKRQDFSLAISYYELSEAFFRKVNKKIANFVSKEIFLSKMAFHYQDN
ncbi:MAG TPA: hypothetical protein PKW55_07660 [Spirochaetota bacterium]|nr:hypothetical protein [Spirochaetota bacterium]HOM38661.1 hypothetical protein [Spirochaetota bacterium]HPQ49823.1 hypothetical protein [Spirochaetota bacterium]